MKVNLKKLGAIVAGATILASSVAFAGVIFSNTRLVDDNGAPAVKVVVGEDAAASDGVAAANIAAKLASEAYKTQTLTAQVAGEATCSASGGEEGSAACTVTSPKSVRLDITVPGGATPGLATVKNLIGDYLNRELDDRDLGLTTYTLGATDIGDAAHFASDGNSTALHSDLTQTQYHKVKGSAFDPMADYKVEDPEASDREYTQTQNLLMWGNNRFLETKTDIVGDLRLVVYQMKFDGATDDLGIPVCTTAVNTSLYASCVASGGNTDDASENHGVKVKFLGEDWIITDMNAPTTGVATETILRAGGSVKIGKESVSGVVNQGEWLEVGGYKFVLADIVADTHHAAIDVVDANGATVSKEKIAEGSTKELSVGGSPITIKVLKTVPGYTFGAKWAKLSVLSKELELSSSNRLNPNKDDNKEWRVILGWKNRGATSTETAPDHLRTVLVYTTDTQNLIDDELEEGDFVPIVQDPTSWKLTYAGLDIDNDNRDSLKFQMERDTTKRNLEVLNGTSNLLCNVTAPYVLVTSSVDNAFRLTSRGTVPSDEGTGPRFYIGTSGISCNGAQEFVRNSVLITSSTSATGQDRYVANNYSGSINVTYELAGDGESSWANGGVIVLQHSYNASNWTNSGVMPMNETLDFNASTISDVRLLIGISEKAGVGTSNAVEGKTVFGLRNTSSAGSWTFNFDGSGTLSVGGSANVLEKDKIRYFPGGPVTSPITGIGTKKEGFITERGSKYESTDDTAVQFKIAKKLAHAEWTLSTSEAAEAEAGTVSKVLNEGESYETENGVKIKVAQVNCQAVASGSVGTGAAPACVVDDSGLSAVIMPQNAASVEASIPYTGSLAGLVVLDRDAANVGTVVTVGGPVVNSKTAEVLQGSDVADPATWPNSRLVREIGVGKIVVAGVNAEDTLAAAQDFVSQLRRQ